MMPIALLKFPTDLLREIFKLCDPFELYKLSKCSKRAQKSITLGGKRNWKISFFGGNEMFISTGHSNYYFNKAMIPKNHLLTILGEYTNHIYIELPVGGVVDLFVYLLEIFGIRTVKSLESSFYGLHNVSKVAKVLIDKKIEIEGFWIRNIDDVQDAVHFMPLMNQMIIRKFQCSIEFPPEFHFEFVQYPNQISIMDSFWFNINQLLNSTCTRIHLQQSELSNQDLNVFLHDWKNTGAFPKLRYLEIQSEKIDNQSPILEMIPPITNVNNPRTKISIRNMFDDQIVDGVRVNKDDGTEGWLIVELGEWPILEFLIADPADTVVEEIPENDDDDW
ncbi:unnamed protein product [Caenorhabditis nigoni]